VGVAGIGEDFKLYEGGELTDWLETTFENKPGEDMEVDDQ
jgi:20S proteasome subunit alpha 6